MGDVLVEGLGFPCSGEGRARRVLGVGTAQEAVRGRFPLGGGNDEEMGRE